MTTGAPAPTAGAPSRAAATVAVAVTLAALAPVVAVLLQRWGRPYVPVGDSAILDLRVHDVWPPSALTPLTGAYSRFGWSHPGPLLYWLLAPLSAVAGGSSWGTLVGSVVLQGVAVAWTARLAWRTGGLRRLVPWTAVQAFTAMALGPGVLLVLWNPDVAAPFFVLLLLQAWVVGSGDTRRLVGLTVVATFLVQTHLGYALPVLAVCTWAVTRLVAAEHRAGRRVLRPRLVGVPAAVVVAVWLVPAGLDAALHPPGNLVALVRSAAGAGPAGHEAIHGPAGGLGLLATEFRWWPPWLGGPDPVNPFVGAPGPAPVAWLLVPVAVLGTAGLLARHRARRDLGLLVELLAVASVAGAVALSLVRGTPFAYLFYWRVALGAAVVVLGLAVVTELLAPALWGARRAAGAVVAVGTVVVAATLAAASVLTARVVADAGPVLPMEPVAAAFLAHLHAEGEPGGRRVLLRVVGTPLGGLQAALVDQLARAGEPVFVDPALGAAFGRARVASPRSVDQEWLVSEDSVVTDRLLHLPGARVLALSHPLPAAGQAALLALETELGTRLVAAGRPGDVAFLSSPLVASALRGVPGMAPRALDRLARLDATVARHTCLCAVVAVPPGTGPGPPAAG